MATADEPANVGFLVNLCLSAHHSFLVVYRPHSRPCDAERSCGGPRETAYLWLIRFGVDRIIPAMGTATTLPPPAGPFCHPVPDSHAINRWTGTGGNTGAGLARYRLAGPFRGKWFCLWAGTGLFLCGVNATHTARNDPRRPRSSRPGWVLSAGSCISFDVR